MDSKSRCWSRCAARRCAGCWGCWSCPRWLSCRSVPCPNLSLPLVALALVEPPHLRRRRPGRCSWPLQPLWRWLPRRGCSTNRLVHLPVLGGPHAPLPFYSVLRRPDHPQRRTSLRWRARRRSDVGCWRRARPRDERRPPWKTALRARRPLAMRRGRKRAGYGRGWRGTRCVPRCSWAAVGPPRSCFALESCVLRRTSPQSRPRRASTAPCSCQSLLEERRRIRPSLSKRMSRKAKVTQSRRSSVLYSCRRRP
mmetsp:Transcript_9216/g.33792  ORF Transcript_9216/g.33792 Transcript_9216/m.33792 type:complete len:253 (-) Transcript_9216:1273-2031(-)